MNSLKDETSPYLLQHVDNPVQWYPWGATALVRALEENKPILLSIGYSACHWCHVMAHESFEDEDTAALMNASFINIKVDREERPDVDKIYQAAHYLLTQNNGGWPLTMFLTPDDHVPFLGGTYFPPTARHGLPAFKDLLVRVANAYAEREGDIRAQNVQLLEALADTQSTDTAPADALGGAPLAAAREQAARAFDNRLGGFGRAPKFPHPGSLDRLLRDFYASGGDDDHARHMVRFTLGRMARGGVFDHIGGGFYRYSTDNQWMIPHFEKMLYDNGPLLATYAEAWREAHDPLYEQIVHDTVAWVQREMTSPDGAFYSSLDADSEGVEGKFYVYERAEMERLLGADFEAFARRFGLLRDANFDGGWHLRIVSEYHEMANAMDEDANNLQRRIEDARRRTFEYRERRMRPGRDEKILTAWNALMIKGLTIAGEVFEREDYLDMATGAVDFIRDTMWSGGRLLATCKDGKAHLNAYLDDYAFTLEALLYLLGARWRTKDLEFAIELADCLLSEFQDSANGGFFFTGGDHEQLIQRTKPLTDDALPAGNGIAAWSLGRLGHLLGEARYSEACENTLRAAWASIENAPRAHNALLLALEEYLDPPSSIVIRGDAPNLRTWRRGLADVFSPRTAIFAIPRDIENLPGILGSHAPAAATTAFLCRGHQCLAPVTDLASLRAYFDIST